MLPGGRGEEAAWRANGTPQTRPRSSWAHTACSEDGPAPGLWWCLKGAAGRPGGALGDPSVTLKGHPTALQGSSRSRGCVVHAFLSRLFRKLRV